MQESSDVDGSPISAEFYKFGFNELLPALELLSNTIVTNEEYPSAWNTGLIHPVYKMMYQIITEKLQNTK